MSDWRECRLEELAASDAHALATGPFGSAISSRHFGDSGVPVIRGSNLSLDVGHRLIEDNFAFLPEEKAASFKRSVARRGDLVFTCWGTVGQVGFISSRSRYPAYVVSNKQMKMTPDQTTVDALFLYYLLSSPGMVGNVQGQAIGTSVPGFNLGQLRKLRVRLPQLSVQSQIAEILGSIDDLIANNRRRIALLEQMAQAIYREWFVHFLYPGHDDDEHVPSSFGAIPAGWAVVRLSDLASIVMGQSPRSEYYNESGDGLPFHQGVSNFGSNYPRHRLYCRIDGRMAQAGDHLVSVRAPVGRINRTDQRIVIGRGLAALRSRSGFQALLGQQLRHVFHEEDVMGGGTIFKAITKGDLEEIPIVRPEAEICRRAEAVLEHVDGLVRDLTFSGRALESIRDLLLPKLVTGAIDVSHLDLDALLDETGA